MGLGHFGGGVGAARWLARQGAEVTVTDLASEAVLAPSLILGIPLVGIWIVAVLANFTAFQRIVHVRRLAHIQMDEGEQAN